MVTFLRKSNLCLCWSNLLHLLHPASNSIRDKNANKNENKLSLFCCAARLPLFPGRLCVDADLNIFSAFIPPSLLLYHAAICLPLFHHIPLFFSLFSRPVTPHPSVRPSFPRSHREAESMGLLADC